MVLAAAGGVDHMHLVELANKYFGKIEHGGEDVLQYEPGVFRESYVIAFAHVLYHLKCFQQLIEDKRMEMVYGSLAVEGTSWTNEDNIPVQVANTVRFSFV